MKGKKKHKKPKPQTKLKYGIKLPRTVEEAIEIEKQNGNTLWHNLIGVANLNDPIEFNIMFESQENAFSIITNKRAQENSLNKRKSRTNTTKEDGLQYEEDEELTFPGMRSHGNASKNSISVRDKRLNVTIELGMNSLLLTRRLKKKKKKGDTPR